MSSSLLYGLGIMSGTSLDGLDICYVEFKENDDNYFKILNSKTFNYNSSWVNKLSNIHLRNDLEIKKIDLEYGLFISQKIMEFKKDNNISNLDFIFSPIGGGGLIAGTSIAIDYLSKSCQLIGAEPSNVDDAYRSLISGKIEFNESTNTIADGLRTNLGSINFPIIQNYVKEILLVSEDEIMDSLDIIINKLKIVVEPSSAVVLAALIKNNKKFKNKNIGLIMCGGNIDFNSLKF